MHLESVAETLQTGDRVANSAHNLTTQQLAGGSMCTQSLRIGLRTNKSRTSACAAAVTLIGARIGIRGPIATSGPRVFCSLSPLLRGEVKVARLSSLIPAPIAFALACLTTAAHAAGDAAKGEAAFERQCLICHTNEKDGENRFGPNLFGIIGKKAGSVPGYAYTNAFKTRANWEWTEDAIGGWMMFPSTMVPGTAMGVFQGIAEKDRDDLVAYLGTLK